MDKKTVRLDKYLSNSGVSSRRKIGELVKKGVIFINGKKAIESGQRIDPEKDEVIVEGKKLAREAHLIYIILNKPLGVLSTTSDELGRKTVLDLINTNVRVYPVGRLDSDSIGLILLTSDGELAHKLTHPKFHIPKTYLVLVRGKVKEGQLKKLRGGILLKDGMTKRAEVKVLEEFKFTTKIEFIISEGRNRQIRRMCGAVDLEILELKRVAIGDIKLGELKEGESRELEVAEIKGLKNLC